MLVKFLTFLVTICLPLYMWAYIFSSLSIEKKWLRARFFAGTLLGLFSVLLVFLGTKFFSEASLFLIFTIFFAIIVLLYSIVWVFSYFGISIARSFLRFIAYIHSLSIFVIILFFGIIISWLTGSYIFSWVLASIFILAFFEEISKHMTVLALMGKYYAFSLRDITIFTFCIVLGFSFIENIFYFFLGNFSSFSLFSRSIFAFSAHLLSAMIATIFWWKALSYPLKSGKYFLFFSLGIIFSVAVHTVFNYFLLQNFFSPLFFYPIGAYAIVVFALEWKK